MILYSYFLVDALLVWDLRNGIMDCHQFGTIGESRFYLYIVYHFSNAIHDIINR